MSKSFWGVIIIIILVFVGIFAFSGNKTTGSSTSKGANTPTEHIEGDSSTGVTLVEYGDYECPYCEEYYTIVQAVQSQYSQLISFQFRNFPLVSIHPNAFAGARAAEAASLQGKFWQMHDALYDNADWEVWSTSTDPSTYFDQYAEEIGLNVPQFETDFASSKVNNFVNADIAAGNKLGIQGTPTFFVDGKQETIPISIGSFETVLNAAIKQKDPSAASTLPTVAATTTTAPAAASTKATTTTTTK